MRAKRASLNPPAASTTVRRRGHRNQRDRSDSGTKSLLFALLKATHHRVELTIWVDIHCEVSVVRPFKGSVPLIEFGRQAKTFIIWHGIRKSDPECSMAARPFYTLDGWLRVRILRN